VKLPNKAAGATPEAAEVVEGRPRAKGRVFDGLLVPHFEAESTCNDRLTHDGGYFGGC
jgi:hypothetical protein